MKYENLKQIERHGENQQVVQQLAEPFTFPFMSLLIVNPMSKSLLLIVSPKQPQKRSAKEDDRMA